MRVVIADHIALLDTLRRIAGGPAGAAATAAARELRIHDRNRSEVARLIGVAEDVRATDDVRVTAIEDIGDILRYHGPLSEPGT